MLQNVALCQQFHVFHFRDERGKTALHMADTRGSQRCVLAILNKNPDCLNTLDENKVSLNLSSLICLMGSCIYIHLINGFTYLMANISGGTIEALLLVVKQVPHNSFSPKEA